MAIDLFAWFTPLGYLGEEMLDLSKCRRFAISEFDGLGKDGLIYYHTKGDRGDDGRWIRCRTYEDYDQNYENMVVDTHYAECHPQEVAYQFLHNRRYGGRLPKELEAYREFGEIRKYREWEIKFREWEIKNYATSQSDFGPSKPVWDAEGMCLSFDGDTCKHFARRAASQFQVIEAFHASSWKPSVPNPFRSVDQLIDTIKTMNRWDDSRIGFTEKNGKAFWRPKSLRG
jgi:hypothetical protein